MVPVRFRNALLALAPGAALVLAATASAQTGPPPGSPPAGFPAGGPPPGAPPGFPPGGPPPGAAPGKRDASQLKMLKPLPPAAPGSRPPSSDPRNFEGIYTAEMIEFRIPDYPLTPKAAADREIDRKRMAEGKPTGGLAAICRPQPTFKVGSDLFPGEIVQTADQVVFLNEEHRTRLNVYLNRDHPKDLKPSYFGDSVGHWEGDTLVIDTVGFNGRERTVSTEAHIVTRVRKLDGGRRLEFQSTTVDPVMYTAPVSDTAVSLWNPDVQMLEFQCEENLEGAMEGLNVSG